jgi:hypothetical protein
MIKMSTVTTGILLIISVLCGCDSKPKENTGNTEVKIIEPSMIITKEDAKALTGVNFGECTVKEQPVVGLKLCVYEKDGAFLQIGITQSAFMDTTNSTTPESIYKSTKSAFKDAARIDGIGDDNFLSPPGLHILKGNYYMTVSLGLVSKDREKLKAAGMKAVENLNKYSGK